MTAALSPSDLWADILAVREHAPLVHSITNFVVMNLNANVLLAAGASPVMAHAHEEVLDMVGIAQSLVLNIGTLEPAWIESMRLALLTATQRGIPAVLDPVGAGLVLELGIHSFPLDRCNDLFETTALRLGTGNHLHLPAVDVGKA